MDNKTKYCTSCWREVDIKAETCECGARFSEPPAPPEKESPGQMGSIEEQGEVQAKKTEFCSNCRAEIAPGAMMCSKCLRWTEGYKAWIEQQKKIEPVSMPQGAPRSIGLSYVAGWAVGGFFLFVGLMGILQSNLLLGLLFTMGALLIFPPFGDYLRRAHNVELSEWLKWIGFFFLTFLASNVALYDGPRGLWMWIYRL